MEKPIVVNTLTSDMLLIFFICGRLNTSQLSDDVLVCKPHFEASELSSARFKSYI